MAPLEVVVTITNAAHGRYLLWSSGQVPFAVDSAQLRRETSLLIPSRFARGRTPTLGNGLSSPVQDQRMVATSSARLAADVLAFGGFDAEAVASGTLERADAVGLPQRAQKTSQLAEAPSVILERESLS